MAARGRELGPFLVGIGAGALAAWWLGRRGAARAPAEVGGPFDAVNRGFHAAYDGAREEVERAAPVLVVLADTLVLLRGGARREVPYTPPLFHVIKSVAHAPIGVFALLYRFGEGSLDRSIARRLGGLRQHFDASSAALEGHAGGAADELRALLGESSRFVDRVLEAGRCPREELEAFAAALRPALVRATEEATRLQLAALHARVTPLLEGLDAAERQALQVVVSGAHQARTRSLAMQYFQKLLGEAPGVERRVTFGEGVDDEAQALVLVGTRRLDRAVAAAFFGEPTRLQRDVLGDAAAQLLRGFALDPVS